MQGGSEFSSWEGLGGSRSGSRAVRSFHLTVYPSVVMLLTCVLGLWEPRGDCKSGGWR